MLFVDTQMTKAVVVVHIIIILCLLLPIDPHHHHSSNKLMDGMEKFSDCAKKQANQHLRIAHVRSLFVLVQQQANKP